MNTTVAGVVCVPWTVSTMPVESEAVAQKLFAAERRIAGVRLVVIATGTVLYPFVLDKAGTVPWLAYTLLGLAWVYGLYVFLGQPYRRYPILLSSYFTTANDAAMTMLWLYATGGFESPFYVALYMAVVSVAFRYPPRETVVAALLYAAAYLGLLFALGEAAGHGGELAVRVTYIGLAALVGAVISREVMAQTAARVELAERLKAEEVHRRLLAEEAVRARDAFLSVASHELRTPLTTLQLQLQTAMPILQRADSSDRLRHKLEMATRQTDRLGRLVNGLLDASRFMTGQLKIERETFDLGELVRDVVERMAEEAEAAGCKLAVGAAPSVVGRWDRLRLEQVLMNLVANAVKYAPRTSIEVSLEEAAGRARLRVRDRGIGIAPEDLARIFLPFERAAPVRHYGGLGLGLYITRQIAEAHGGSIEVESRPGEGSTFIVSLPLTPPRPPEAEAVPAENAPGPR